MPGAGRHEALRGIALPHLAAEVGQLAAHRAPLHGPVHGQQQLLGGDGLREVVERAGPDRLHGGIDGAVGGDEQDLRLVRTGARQAQHLQPVPVGKHQVREHQLELAGLQGLRGAADVLRGLHVVPVGGEHVLEQAPDRLRRHRPRGCGGRGAWLSVSFRPRYLAIWSRKGPVDSGFTMNPSHPARAARSASCFIAWAVSAITGIRAVPSRDFSTRVASRPSMPGKRHVHEDQVGRPLGGEHDPFLRRGAWITSYPAFSRRITMRARIVGSSSTTSSLLIADAQQYVSARPKTPVRHRTRRDGRCGGMFAVEGWA